MFAPLSKSVVQGTQLYWKQQNAAGGVCGRTVEVVVKDHGYDPQKAVSVYREISGDVLGMQTVLGSPVVSALRPTIGQDNMYVGVAGWPASVLDDQHLQLLGTTYDIEAITGLDFLMRTKGIKSGDKVGHVYFEGDFGENALQGQPVPGRAEGADDRRAEDQAAGHRPVGPGGRAAHRRRQGDPGLRRPDPDRVGGRRGQVGRARRSRSWPTVPASPRNCWAARPDRR